MTAQVARRRPRLAIFAATSGHSGVDRIVRNLAGQLDTWEIPVDLLRIAGHGPEVALEGHRHTRRIDLGSAHVNSALPGLIRYLRQQRPGALLTDKDRVNRIAILARALARVDTRLAVRLGTTVSVNLEDRRPLERWLQRTSMRRLYPLADRVIVPSAGAASDLADYAYLRPSHISVVPSPIVTEAVEALAAERPDHPWLCTGEPPVVLGVGELGYRKDFATLIRAFAAVRQRLRCRLLILGRGRRRDALLALATELGVADDVALPGFTANPYAYMARASVFVLSSRWEGMPVALIEALACGTPAVATDCPSGPREVLVDSAAGTLVPVGDVPAMAAAIVQRLGRPADLTALQCAARPYRVESSARAYLGALGLVAEERRGSSQ